MLAIAAIIAAISIAWMALAIAKVRRHPSHTVSRGLGAVIVGPIVSGTIACAIGMAFLAIDMLFTPAAIDDWFYDPLAVLAAMAMGLGVAIGTGRAGIKSIISPDYRRMAEGHSNKYDDHMLIGLLARPPIKPRACATPLIQTGQFTPSRPMPITAVDDVLARVFERVADQEDDTDLAAQRRLEAAAIRGVGKAGRSTRSTG